MPLDQSYFKTDMLELAAVYVKAVPALAIDDAVRLRLSNRTMSDNIQRMEDEEGSKIERLEDRMRLMGSEKDARIADLESHIRRMISEKDVRSARLEDRMRLMGSEKDARIADLESHIRRMDQRVSSIGDRGGTTVDEILDALSKSPKTAGCPARCWSRSPQ